MGHAFSGGKVAQGLVVAAEGVVDFLGVQTEKGLAPLSGKVLGVGQHLFSQTRTAGGGGQMVDVVGFAVVAVGPPGVPGEKSHDAGEDTAGPGDKYQILPNQPLKVGGRIAGDT